MRVCTYVHIYPHMCGYICVEVYDTGKRPQLSNIYISEHLVTQPNVCLKSRVMENGQRNYIKCVRIVGMNDRQTQNVSKAMPKCHRLTGSHVLCWTYSVCYESGKKWSRVIWGTIRAFLEGGLGGGGRVKKSHWIGLAYLQGFVNYYTIDHDDVICPPLQSAYACSTELWFAQGKRT